MGDSSSSRQPDAQISERKAPEHLNNTGCHIKYIEGKGRGVFASREVPRDSLIEISPTLLFSVEEYEEHGKYTVLDHYTFKWRDGRMALALGLGSLFNHSRTPNISYTLDPDTESIRYTTTRTIHEGEELCIFYGHKLWFEPTDTEPKLSVPDEKDDGWGGLFNVENEDRWGTYDPELPHYLTGSPGDIIPEEQLPFVRMKLVEDKAEDDLDSVRTESAWVVDIPDPRHTNVLLKWLKQSGLDTPALAHLKRVRKAGSKTTLLVTTVMLSPTAPSLPSEIELSGPYVLDVPRNPALTIESLKIKTTLWPTIYTPRKKGELESITTGQARWAWQAMRVVVQEAKASKAKGELPIAAYVPIPYDEETRASTQLFSPLVAHDTRHKTEHPLRHAALNLIRKAADYRATPTVETVPAVKPVTLEPPGSAMFNTASRNGSHYLLTSLTLFISHEPCMMCSMALLHSRVKEVFYLKAMGKTGGCGGSACVSKLEGVNHRFGIAQWKMGAELGDSALNLDEATDA